MGRATFYHTVCTVCLDVKSVSAPTFNSAAFHINFGVAIAVL